MHLSNLLQDLFPAALNLRIHNLSFGDTLTITLASTRSRARCPDCRASSTHLHSRYCRTAQDLPCFGIPVKLRLQVRRYRCPKKKCPRSTFAERYPELVTPYSRVTERLRTFLERIAVMIGAEPGARLLEKVGARVSPDRILAVISALPDTPLTCPAVIGIDEFAFRRGHSYGTIIVNLENGTPVDVLPDRNVDTVAAWLEAHPQVRIVARDRSKEFARAITRGAPEAVQVLDRWHVLKNLREALERELAARHNTISEHLKGSDVIPEKPKRSRQERESQRASLARRRERNARIRNLIEQGKTITATARSVGVSRPTVYRALGTDGQLMAQRKPKRPSPLDAFETSLERHFAEGLRNARQLWREVRELGYGGSDAPVRRWLGQRQAIQEANAESARRLRATPKALAWLLLRDPERLTMPEQRLLAELVDHFPDVAGLRGVARAFVKALLEGVPELMDAWLEEVKASDFTFVQSFATGLQREWGALKAACSLPWSNGPTEGVVNRVKLIKRQMYGRGSFELLRKRVLLAA